MSGVEEGSSVRDLFHLFWRNGDLIEGETGIQPVDREIVRKGKEVEEFIREWEQTNKEDTCLKLLRVLFQLFKSEVTMNIVLKKKLANIDQSKSFLEQNEQDMKRLFACVQQYNKNASKLTDVLALYKAMKCKSKQSDQQRQLEDAENTLEKMIQKCQRREQKHESSIRELELVQSQWKERIESQQKEYDEARALEKDLTDKLCSLEQVNTSLREELKTVREEDNPKQLKHTLALIDIKVEELQKKISLLTRKHERDTQKCKAAIQRLKLEDEAMQQETCEMKRALDTIHSKIDMYTNPLTAANQDIPTPHTVRVRLDGSHARLEEQRKKIKSEERQCQKLAKNIDELKAGIQSITKDIDRDNVELQHILREVNEKESVIEEMRSQRDGVSRTAGDLRRLERERRSIEAQIIQLKTELDLAKARTRQLVIDNHSLKQSLEVERASRVTLCPVCNKVQSLPDHSLPSCSHAE